MEAINVPQIREVFSPLNKTINQTQLIVPNDLDSKKFKSLIIAEVSNII